MPKRRTTWEERYEPLDWQYIVTRGLVIGLAVGIATVIAIPYLIVATAR